MIKKYFLPFILVLIPVLYFVAPKNISYSQLESQIRQIDDDFSGNLGVYLKNLESGTTVNYNADRLWYLASTVKVPIAMAILQKVEKGELSLDDKVILKESDMVDGSGELIWQNPGSSYTVKELLQRMIRDSDSIAADMLIRLMGEEEFNEHIKKYILSDGIEQITTILQVRYDAYSELHENASKLTNLDIIKLKVSSMQERLNEFARMTSTKINELKVNSIPEAFEKYYERGLNSGELQAMGLMLEKLAEGEYLNPDHTSFLLEIMKEITTGDRRIKAGLPKGNSFAQKTGTQISRACNLGIINPQEDKNRIIVVVCAEKYNDLAEAESVFEKIGNLITENWLTQKN